MKKLFSIINLLFLAHLAYGSARVSYKHDSLPEVSIIDIAVFENVDKFKDFLITLKIKKDIIDIGTNTYNFAQAVGGKLASKAYETVGGSSDLSSLVGSTVDYAIKIAGSVAEILRAVNIVEPKILNNFVIKDGWKTVGKGRHASFDYTGYSPTLYVVAFYNPPYDKKQRRILWITEIPANGEYGFRLIKQADPALAQDFGPYLAQEGASYLTPITSIQEAFYGAGSFPSSLSQYNADKNKYKDVIEVTEKLRNKARQSNGSYFVEEGPWMTPTFGDPKKGAKKLQATFTTNENQQIKNWQFNENEEFSYS